MGIGEDGIGWKDCVSQFRDGIEASNEEICVSQTLSELEPSREQSQKWAIFTHQDLQNACDPSLSLGQSLGPTSRSQAQKRRWARQQ